MLYGLLLGWPVLPGETRATCRWGAPVLANSRNAPSRFGAAARRQYSLLDKEYLDCFIRHPLPSSCYNC